MSAPQGAMQVREDWILYDTIRIGSTVPETYPGGAASFAALAAFETIAFLNVRDSSVGKGYCNLSSSDKFPWPFMLKSIGMRFSLCDPVEDDQTAGNQTIAKWFVAHLPEFASLRLWVAEDDKLLSKPRLMPSGYGVVGMGNSGLVTGPPDKFQYLSYYENGKTILENRWKWKTPVRIPDNTPVRAELKFSTQGKAMLAAMSVSGTPYFVSDQTNYPIEAQIVLSLKGNRYVQQRGELYAS